MVEVYSGNFAELHVEASVAPELGVHYATAFWSHVDCYILYYSYTVIVVYIMFASRPQTTHLARHYTNTAKKTGGRNVDKENAGALPSKTPSKGGLGRGMLVPNTAKPLGKARGDEKGKSKEDDIGECPLFR